MEDPYKYQKLIAETNRRRIVRSLGLYGPGSFTEIKNELGMSKPVLSGHLKHLKKKGVITRVWGLYQLTDQASQTYPSLRTIYFEVRAYRQMMNELLKPGEPLRFVARERPIGPGEALLYADLHPESIDRILKGISESELAEAFDKWMTPIILSLVVREIRDGEKWTDAVHGILDRIRRVVREKDRTIDVSRFEGALKRLYSTRVVQLFPADGVSVLECLDGVFEQIEKRKQIDELFSELFEKYRKSGGKIDPKDRSISGDE